MKTLYDFIRESNLIEGIDRAPTNEELYSAQQFIDLDAVDAPALCSLQAVFAPGKPLRETSGMDVRVGRHIAPLGGPHILGAMEAILKAAQRSASPWATHMDFENLHPFMDGNGRTGRALWAWEMKQAGKDPFELPFLHRFYYQTLDSQR